MPTQPVEYRNFKGLLLPLDRKRIAEPYVVDGKNFIVDLDGPVSIFGRTWISYDDVDEPRGWQTCGCIASSTIFWYLEDCIAIFDAETRQLFPVYVHAVRTEFWPWSTASVGGVQYFANKEIGLLSRNPLTGVWTVVSGANIPPVVHGCCEAYGRLIVLGSEADGSAPRACWSSIDDGSNTGFAPSTATGAGFQVLTVVAGRLTPFLPLSYADGFVAYTSAGIVKFESVQAANPFRFRILTRENAPLNPWVITRFGGQAREQHLFLTHRGFYTTFGEDKPTLWQELTSEELHRNILPRIDHRQQEFTTRLSYDLNSGWVLLSISTDSRPLVYSYALCFYEISNEWGRYSKAHCGFGSVYLSHGPFLGTHFGVCDTNGIVWRFSLTDSDRTYPVESLFLVDYKQPGDPPVQRMASGTSIMNDWVRLYDEDIDEITDAGVYDTQYVLDEFISPAEMPDPAQVNNESPSPDVLVSNIGMQMSALEVVVREQAYSLQPLDAFILIGPIVFPQQDKIDLVSQFQELTISMLDAGTDDEFEDYVDDYTDITVEEEWNTLTAVEDWGESAGNNTEYSLKLIGTLDGYSVWTVNGISQEVIPDLLEQTGRNKHVVGQCNGVYLYLKIMAENLGETFHLKVLRSTLTTAGQLY